MVKGAYNWQQDADINGAPNEYASVVSGTWVRQDFTEGPGIQCTDSDSTGGVVDLADLLGETFDGTQRWQITAKVRSPTQGQTSSQDFNTAISLCIDEDAMLMSMHFPEGLTIVHNWSLWHEVNRSNPDNSTERVASEGGLSDNWEFDTVYMMRVEYDPAASTNGTLRGRYWLTTESEPTSWVIEADLDSLTAREAKPWLVGLGANTFDGIPAVVLSVGWGIGEDAIAADALVEGNVSDYQTGSDAPNPFITIESHNGYFYAPGGANSFYQIVLESGQTYDIKANAPGYHPETKTVTVSGDTTLNFQLLRDEAHDRYVPGGRVVLCDGTYELGQRVEITRRATHLEGMGGATHLRPASALSGGILVYANEEDARISHMLLVDSGDNLNGVSDAVWLGSGADYSAVESVHTHGLQFYSEADYSALFQVEHHAQPVVTDNGGLVGIKAIDGWRVRVSGGFVSRTRQHGIQIGGSGSGPNNIVEGVLVEDPSGDSSDSYDGIHVPGGTRHIISRNTVVGCCPRYGIYDDNFDDHIVGNRLEGVGFTADLHIVDSSTTSAGNHADGTVK